MMKRRDLLKAAGLGAAAMVMPRWVHGAAADRAGDKPNIIYILADDLGWNDVGYHGSVIKTPHIDALAKTGTQLNQFYAMPICTPTRAALLTGRYPIRYGLQVEVVRPHSRYGLPLEERTLADAMKAAGYATAICGKWHLGHFDRKYVPTRRGFDHQYGCYTGQIDYFKHEIFGGLDWRRDEEPLRESGYATDLIGRECVRLIEQHDPSKPLFLYAAFTAPHMPLQAPPRYVEMYKHIKHEPRRLCAAMVTCMDDQIGRIVAALETQGLRDNTLIVFSSDNGGLDTPRDPNVSDNKPLRGGKYSLYEGGVRAAALVNWPGKTPADKIIDQPMHIVDMYPTLVKLAGGSLQQKLPLDGLDVSPVITAAAPSPHKDILLNVFETGGGVRRGDWKLIGHNLWGPDAKPGGGELFDIAKDPGETTNLAKQHPEVVAELTELLKRYHDEAAKPLSTGGAPPAGFKPPKVWAPSE